MGRNRILIADDEQGFRDLFRFAVQPCGYEVETASNGIEALEKYRRDSFALVVLDMHMPQMNGVETFRQIRKIHPQQPVILMTASVLPEQLAELQKLQTEVLCLYKPLELDEILGALEKVLQKREPNQ